MEHQIHELTFNGNVIQVDQTLKKEHSLIDERDSEGNTPLHLACWAKQTGLLGVLLAYKPDLNAKGYLGRTALHYAVHEGNPMLTIGCYMKRKTT